MKIRFRSLIILVAEKLTDADWGLAGCLGLGGIFDSSRHEALFSLFRNCVILWALKWTYDRHFPAIPEAANGADAPMPAAVSAPGPSASRPHTDSGL